MKFRDITEHAGTSPSRPIGATSISGFVHGPRKQSWNSPFHRGRSREVPSDNRANFSPRIGPIPRWRTSISRVSTIVYEIKREVKIPSNGFTSVLSMSYRSIFFRNGRATFVSGIFFLGLVLGVHREKNDPEIGSRRVNRPSRDRFAQFRREVYTCTYIYVCICISPPSPSFSPSFPRCPNDPLLMQRHHRYFQRSRNSQDWSALRNYRYCPDETTGVERGSRFESPGRRKKRSFSFFFAINMENVPGNVRE